jgi:hypothetical protein
MPIDLSSHKVEAGCALGVAVLVACWRILKYRSAGEEFFASVAEAMLAGALLPVAAVLIYSPFNDAPFDAVRYELYLAFGGVALLFIVSVIIRRALRPERKKDPDIGVEPL